jgi:ribosomal protein L37E
MHAYPNAMWRKKNNMTVHCSECHSRLPAQAEACAECGYPVTAHASQYNQHEGAANADLEYKLVQLLGAVVFAAGIFAAFAESPIAATVALTIGGATYLSGLMGAWWNSGD